MRILIVIHDLKIGGAQTWVARLAKELAASHSVYIYEYDSYSSRRSKNVLDLLPENIKVIKCPPVLDWIGRKANRILDKFRIQKDVWFLIKKIHFNLSVHLCKIDVVNTHLYYADWFSTSSLRKTKIPIVLSDHGDYRYVINEKISNPDEVQKIFDRVDQVIYLSDSNAESITKYIKNKEHKAKIYNGIAQVTPNQFRQTAREYLNINIDAFVFGMVARGIPEKGWKETISAFKTICALTSKDIHLILVGASEYLSNLEKEVEIELRPFIHFVGHAADPNYWIDAFDVGLLPSYFLGESLPNSVIEYLSLSKPVIATRVGGIPEMLRFEGQEAGILVGLSQAGTGDVTELTVAMLNYINDSSLLERHSKLAQEAFKKFQLDRCVEAYEKTLAEVICRARK